MADEIVEDDDFLKPDELLPGWITSRMMNDEWPFGLMTDTGIIIGIERIMDVYQAADGTVWVDVILLDKGFCVADANCKIFFSPTGRKNASINTNHIVAAFELSDS